MASKYTDETKTQIRVEWMAGATLDQIATSYTMPKSTVQSMVKGMRRTELIHKKSLSDYDFDSAAEQLIDGSVRAAASILRAAEDHEWIKGHSPNEAAILFGVIADKLYRLLGAIDREASAAELPERAGEATQSEMA
jgi:transposase